MLRCLDVPRQRKKPKKPPRSRSVQIGHGQKLDRLGAIAIVALLTETSNYAAARRIGIARSTLQTWLNDPDFAAELVAAKEELVRGTLNTLHVASRTAVKGLMRQVGAKDALVAYRAAVAILENTHQATEQQDVIERLKRVEQGQHHAAGSDAAR
jgi:hypothetical protein